MNAHGLYDSDLLGIKIKTIDGKVYQIWLPPESIFWIAKQICEQENNTITLDNGQEEFYIWSENIISFEVMNEFSEKG